MKALLSGLLVLGTIHAAATAVESCPPGTFVSTATVSTSDQPQAVATGDFNGDGHQDLLVTMQYEGVSVFLGTGDGSFGPAINTPGDYGASFVATGYFDSDSHLDAAYATYYEGIEVLIGNGDGSFQTPVPYALSGGVTALAAADLTGDGKMDLIATVSQPPGIAVLAGNGDGTFAAAIQTNTATTPVGLAIGDFNGDGLLDVAVTSSSNVVSVYLGTGGGHLAPPLDIAVGTTLGPIVAGDFNDDGKLDLAFGVGNDVGVLRGNGDGTFRAAIEYPVSFPVGSLVTADLDGDGRTDIVGLRTSPYYYGQAGIVVPLLQQPDGSLRSTQAFLAGLGSVGLAVGDFNEDTTPDFATADGQGLTLSLLFGETGGLLIAPTYASLQAAPIALASGDFDGDGSQDVAALGGYGGPLQIVRVVDGIPTPLPPIELDGQASDIVAADFDGDQKLDLAITMYFGVEIFFGNGDGTFQPPVTVPLNYNLRWVVAGDLNGDGAPDLAVQNSDFGTNVPEITALLNDGHGNFTVGPVMPLGHQIAGLIGGRFDPGSTFDLVASNGDCCGSQFNTVLFLRGNGDGSFHAPMEYPTGGHPGGLAAGDFNGDEAPDLVVANTDASSVSILLNDGLGGFGAPTSVGIGWTPSLVAAADFDFDGQTDVFTVNSNNQNASLLLGAGGGTFQAPVIYPAPSGLSLLPVNFGGRGSDVAIGTGDLALEVLFDAHLSVDYLYAPTVLVNTPARLVASASGFGPLAYQWKRNGVPLIDGNGISGPQTPALTIDPATFADRSVGYGVSVTDSCGTAASNAISLDVEFADVSIFSPFHGDILAIATAGITSGCGGSNYCPTSPVRRDQMAAFLLKSEHGAAYLPPPCTGIFADVPCPSTFANWIEQLAAESVTSGCGNGNYCPDSSVTRAQMAVFLLKTKNGPSYVPPPATGIFGDVPVGSFAADYIEALYNQGISGGCQTSPLLYCPDNPVLRQQMATLLVRTFNLP